MRSLLDCDTTIKLLYGNQDGAEIGYNPTKPGRPSHNIHTCWIANLRLVPGAEVKGGKTQPAKCGLTKHAGQSRILLTLTHAAGFSVKSMVTNVRKGLDTILATAPQLTKRERWAALVRYIVERILAAKPKKSDQPTLIPSNFSPPLIPATG